MSADDCYPMKSGGPWFRPSDLAVLFRRAFRRLHPVRQQKQLDISQNLIDRVLPFDEYPPCAFCGQTRSTEVLIARDGNRVVECAGCGLWFTSPRVAEPRWLDWLGQQDSERNAHVTENRLRHGVALDRNIPYSFSFWWRIRRRRFRSLIRELMTLHAGRPSRFFDVGCGVGFLLQAGKEAGLEVTGNDLNSYAVSRMRQVLGLNVYASRIAELANDPEVAKGQDIIVMRDYIEHTYHPLEDLRAAHRIMANNGLLYVHTFFVDSGLGIRCGRDWDQHMWNHTYHFSSKTLPLMVERAGFRVEHINLEQDNGIIVVAARKA
jgi:2-polyprenyl-3-methyl-5-hydroxy-6-metoxy-1,4-benzoquinol methylase